MLLRLHIIQLPLTVIYRIIFWGNSSNITEVFLLQKKDDKNKDDSKFEMFLQRYILKT
jgi:hypothetical protein